MMTVFTRLLVTRRACCARAHACAMLAGERHDQHFFLPLFRGTLQVWGMSGSVMSPAACVGVRKRLGGDVPASEAGEGQRLGA